MESKLDIQPLKNAGVEVGNREYDVFLGFNPINKISTQLLPCAYVFIGHCWWIIVILQIGRCRQQSSDHAPCR